MDYRKYANKNLLLTKKVEATKTTIFFECRFINFSKDCSKIKIKNLINENEFWIESKFIVDIELLGDHHEASEFDDLSELSNCLREEVIFLKKQIEDLQKKKCSCSCMNSSNDIVTKTPEEILFEKTCQHPDFIEVKRKMEVFDNNLLEKDEDYGKF
jgi:hypothetical protein